MNYSQLSKETSAMKDDQDRLLMCFSTPLAIFGFVFYAVIFFLGVTGNFLVIFTVYKDSRLHTSFNYLVVNLAISDICVFFFSLPIVVFSECFAAWPLRDFYCRLSRPLFSVFTGVSVGTMVTLHFERYRAVATPLALKLTHKIAKRVIAVIWVLSYALFGLPKSFMFELTTANGILQCDAIYTSTTIPILIKTWRLICTLFIPSTGVCWTFKQPSYVHTQARSSDHRKRVCASRDITRSHAKRNAKMMGLLF